MKTKLFINWIKVIYENILDIEIANKKGERVFIFHKTGHTLYLSNMHGLAAKEHARFKVARNEKTRIQILQMAHYNYKLSLSVSK